MVIGVFLSQQLSHHNYFINNFLRLQTCTYICKQHFDIGAYICLTATSHSGTIEFIHMYPTHLFYMLSSCINTFALW